MRRIFATLVILLLIFGVVSSCKARQETTSETAGVLPAFLDPKARQVCCAYQQAAELFEENDNQSFDKTPATMYDTVACSADQKSEDCCPRLRDKLHLTSRTFKVVNEGSCDDRRPEELSTVQVCRGPTRFGKESPVVGGISDSASGVLKLAHVWIKTSHVEMGMGPKDWSSVNANQAKVRTSLENITAIMTAESIRQKLVVAWRDHQNFSTAPGATCSPLYLCDERCVENKLLVKDSDLGTYSPVNQCHVATVNVLRQCGCFNHCVLWGPAGRTCLKRVFPELRGFKLQDNESDGAVIESSH